MMEPPPEPVLAKMASVVGPPVPPWIDEPAAVTRLMLPAPEAMVVALIPCPLLTSMATPALTVTVSEPFWVEVMIPAETAVMLPPNGT